MFRILYKGVRQFQGGMLTAGFQCRGADNRRRAKIATASCLIAGVNLIAVMTGLELSAIIPLEFSGLRLVY